MAPEYCLRCGFRSTADRPGPFDPRFCASCFDGVADEARAREIVDAAAGGEPGATMILARIADARASSVLVETLAHEDARLRAHALDALALVGDVRAVPAVADLLDDDSRSVRDAALRCLRELGSTAAADALAERLEDEELGTDAAVALAALGDRRAFAPLVALLDRPEAAWTHYRSPFWAFAALGDQAAVPHLVDALDRLAETWDEADPAEPAWWTLPHAQSIVSALLSLGDEQAERAADAACARFDGRLRHVPTMPASPEWRFTYPDAHDERRMVPTWSLELSPAQAPIAEPETKFGGQPVWLEEPTWPLTRDGAPMTFLAQFRLPEPPLRLAYLFVDLWEGLQRSDEGDACVVVQPGGVPEQWERRRTGPTYPTSSHLPLGVEPVPRSRTGLVEWGARLVEGGDPPDWSGWLADPARQEFDSDWNKVGGTPLFLQAEEWPDGDGWRFLAQFSAARMGHELGDGAECYVFVDDDGRGNFFWQCH